MMWSMYEIIHIWTAVVDKSEEYHGSKFSNVIGKKKPEKNQGFNGKQAFF